MKATRDKLYRRENGKATDGLWREKYTGEKAESRRLSSNVISSKSSAKWQLAQ
jgi:hypothetical protein